MGGMRTHEMRWMSGVYAPVPWVKRSATPVPVPGPRSPVMPGKVLNGNDGGLWQSLPRDVADSVLEAAAFGALEVSKRYSRGSWSVGGCVVDGCFSQPQGASLPLADRFAFGPVLLCRPRAL